MTTASRWTEYWTSTTEQRTYQFRSWQTSNHISTLEIRINSTNAQQLRTAQRNMSGQKIQLHPNLVHNTWLIKQTKHPPNLRGSNREWKFTRNQILRGTNGVRHTHNQCCHHNDAGNESNTSFCISKSSLKGRLNRIQSSPWFRLCRYYNEHSSIMKLTDSNKILITQPKKPIMVQYYFI